MLHSPQETSALLTTSHGSRPGLSDGGPGLTHIGRNVVTDDMKIRRILQALDDRARGLLDAEGLVDTLLAILGRDPYAEWERLAS